MATAMKSTESNSGDSANQAGQDEPDAFTRREQLERAKAQYNREKQVRWLLTFQFRTLANPLSQRFDLSPTTTQLLGTFDIFCLVLNRTIGSGIFTVPPKVL